MQRPQGFQEQYIPTDPHAKRQYGDFIHVRVSGDGIDNNGLYCVMIRGANGAEHPCFADTDKQKVENHAILITGNLHARMHTAREAHAEILRAIKTKNAPYREEQPEKLIADR